MPTNPNWSEEEDEALRRLVEEYGPKKWSLIASKLKTKGSKQCRRRWKNYLNADLKQGGWSPEEDRILIDGHRKYGNKWTEIAKLVGGRTDNAVKNRWAALCKKMSKGTMSRGGRRSKHVEDSPSDSDEDEDVPSSGPSPSSPRVVRTRRTAAQQQQQQQQQAAQVHAPMPPPQQQYQPLQWQHPQPMIQNGIGSGVKRGLDMDMGGYGGYGGPAPKRLNMANGVPQLTAMPTLQGSYHHQPAHMQPGYRPPPYQPPQSIIYPSALRQSPRTAAGGMGSGMGMGGAGPSTGPANMRGMVPSPPQPPQAPSTSSPPGRGKKPELTLFIPNPAAADPPAVAPQNGVQIHVHKDILSPVELRYVEELNDMDIPLQISLEDEPPLSTSRRAAQDALDALVSSPTGLGPLTLSNALPSANGGFDDLLRWFQTGLTPRSTKGNGAGPSGRTPRGSQGTGSNLTTAQLPSPGRMTRSMARGNTPRGQTSAQPLPPQPPLPASRGATPRGRGSTPRGSQGLVAADGSLHDGHKQLISKLLVTHKSEVEDLIKTHNPLSPSHQGTIPPAPAQGSGTRPSTRNAMTGAQAAAALSQSLPTMPNGAHNPPPPTRTTRRSSGMPPATLQGPELGSQQGAQHPGLTGGLTLNSLGQLASPGPNTLGFGPLSSTRSGWKGLDVMLTPNFSQQELSMLLDVLNGD